MRKESKESFLVKFDCTIADERLDQQLEDQLQTEQM